MDRIVKLMEFIAADPKDFFSRHALAMEFVKAGKEEDAIQLLDNIISENPEYIGSYLHLGKLLEKSGEVEEALNVYSRGIEEAGKLNDNHARGELQTAIDLMD